MRRRQTTLAAALLGGCAFDASGAGSGAGTGGMTDESAEGSSVGDGTGTSTGTASSASVTESTADPTESTGTTTETTTQPVADDSSSSAGTDSTGELPAVPWCDPQQPALAGCYAFGDLGSGVLVDDSTAGNHGTIAAIAIDAGPLGEAAVFSTNSEVRAPAHPATDFPLAATIEVLLRIDAMPGSGRAGVIDRDGQWSMFLYPGEGLRCGGSEFVFWETPTVGEWMHVACVIGEGSVRVYVGGALVAERPTKAAIPIDNQGPLAFGDDSPSFASPLSGAIGGVRLWSVVRTPEQLCEGAGTLCP